MSKGGVDTFALAIKHLNEFRTLMHVIVGLFKVHDTIRISMVRQM
jgi:hypothetical protein